MARLGIEPRLPENIPGALPLSYLALGNQLGLPVFVTTSEQIAHPTTTPRNAVICDEIL